MIDNWLGLNSNNVEGVVKSCDFASNDHAYLTCEPLSFDAQMLEEAMHRVHEITCFYVDNDVDPGIEHDFHVLGHDMASVIIKWPAIATGFTELYATRLHDTTCIQYDPTDSTFSVRIISEVDADMMGCDETYSVLKDIDVPKAKSTGLTLRKAIELGNRVQMLMLQKYADANVIH